MASGYKPTDQNLGVALIRGFGARDLAMGVPMLATWYCGDYRALGWMTLVGTVVASADGYASKKATGGGEWMHWPFAPVLLSVGLGLLGWV